MIHDGWLDRAIKHLSPNFNERPQNLSVNALIIHNISLPPAQFGGGFVEQFFLNCLDAQADPYFQHIKNLQVSSHCFIDRYGACTQFVPFDQRAWHAGQSQLDGVPDCNNYSIGIELEGTDTIPYTSAQYDSLVSISLELMRCFPDITLARIVGHNDIAPARKSDPGPSFDWLRFRTLLRHALADTRIKKEAL